MSKSNFRESLRLSRRGDCHGNALAEVFQGLIGRICYNECDFGYWATGKPARRPYFMTDESP